MRRQKISVGVWEGGSSRVVIQGNLEFEDGVEGLPQQDACTRLVLQYKAEEMMELVGRRRSPEEELWEEEWQQLWGRWEQEFEPELVE